MRALVGLVAAAALGLGAWWLMRAPADEELDLEGLERTDTDASTGPTLEGLEGSERSPSRAPTGRSSIAGRVSRDGQPTAAEVTLRFLHGRVGPDRAYPRRGVDYYRRVMFGRPPAAPLVVATRSTDASGRFELTGLGLGVYRVEARASDGARGLSVVALAPDGVRATTEVRLAAPGAAFEGRVEWNDGAVFEGDLIVIPTAGVQDGWGTSFRSSAEAWPSRSRTARSGSRGWAWGASASTSPTETSCWRRDPASPSRSKNPTSSSSCGPRARSGAACW
jgi:hypothetical protein